MASTFGKRTWIHQLVALCSLILLSVAYLMMFGKQESCETPFLSRNELANWTGPPVRGISKQALMTELSVSNLRARNKHEFAARLVDYVAHYYDSVVLCHYVLLVWSVILLLLGCVNIVPKHPDLKVLTILLTILLMGILALFAFGTAFVLFNKPCRDSPQSWDAHNHTDTVTPPTHRSNQWIELLQRQWIMRQIQFYELFNDYDRVQQLRNSARSFSHLRASVNGSFVNSTLPLAYQEREYSLRFRAIKDKRPVNVYEDDDNDLVQVTLIDASVGFILLCSTFLYFFDSRQHMIEWRN